VLYLAVVPAPSAAMRRNRVLLGALSAAPLAMVAVLDARAGRWNAFLLTQRQAGGKLINPLALLWHIVVTRQTAIQTMPGNGALAWWIATETAMTATIVLGACAAVIVSWRRRSSVDRLEALIVVTVFTIWISNLATNAGSGPYRGAFALLPVVILLRRLKPALLWATAFGCGVVAYGVSAYFFVPFLAPGGLV
jgi:hypothetical protein